MYPKFHIPIHPILLPGDLFTQTAWILECTWGSGGCAGRQAREMHPSAMCRGPSGGQEEVQGPEVLWICQYSPQDWRNQLEGDGEMWKQDQPLPWPSHL